MNPPSYKHKPRTEQRLTLRSTSQYQSQYQSQCQRQYQCQRQSNANGQMLTATQPAESYFWHDVSKCLIPIRDVNIHDVNVHAMNIKGTGIRNLLDTCKHCQAASSSTAILYKGVPL
jgi:hypothetical protein